MDKIKKKHVLASVLVFLMFLTVRQFPNIIFYNIIHIEKNDWIIGIVGAFPLILGLKRYSIIYFYAFLIGWVVNIMAQPFMLNPDTYVINGGMFQIFMVILGVIVGVIAEAISYYMKKSDQEFSLRIIIKGRSILVSLIVFFVFLFVRQYPNLIFFNKTNIENFDCIVGVLGVLPLLFGFRWYSIAYFYAFMIGWVISIMLSLSGKNFHNLSFNITLTIMSIITGSVAEVIYYYVVKKNQSNIPKVKYDIHRLVRGLTVLFLFIFLKIFLNLIFLNTIKIGFYDYIAILFGTLPLIFGYKWYSIIYFYIFMVGWVIDMMSQLLRLKPDTYIMYSGRFHVFIILFGIILGVCAEIINYYANKRRNKGTQ